MSTPPLNQLQLDVLGWIRDGCPPGLYGEGFEHRISARALERRGLVQVRGHGASWSASLTEGGAYYLEHGEYRPPPVEPQQPRSPSAPARPTAREKPASPAGPKPAAAKPKKPPRVGATDAMMMALAEAEDHAIAIVYEETQRYTQLARTAERFKKIPEGMQVVVTHEYRTRSARVALVPLPPWRTAVLDPIKVPGTLRAPSDVVTAIGAREDLHITAGEKKRALRLLQALVDEARRRGYVVKAVPEPRKDRWGYTSRDEEHLGHLKIMLGPDEYRLTVYQLTEKVAHVASKSELARAGRGYAVPNWDHLPTKQLGIRIDTTGRHFWGTYWVDTDPRPLDAALAQILQELELRHEAAEDRRLAEERERLERRRKWEVAREKAIEALAEHHRAKVLKAQVSRWRQATRIRDYVVHIEQDSLPILDEGAKSETVAWLDWARHYADRLDPSGEHLRLPDPPEPTPTALQPFMGHWSAYGPDTHWRG